jgi:hypothetical protein
MGELPEMQAIFLAAVALRFVIPAQAGIQQAAWTPAFAE